jgi:TPR repeat protein
MDEEALGRGKIGLCAFCRKPTPTSNEEIIKQLKKLMEADNARAFANLAGYYDGGIVGMAQDFAKANELFLRAGELGYAEAYANLGNSYYNGSGVDVDKKKATDYWELAAMNGDVDARRNLGCMEAQVGNHQRALKHFVLAARAGHKKSLSNVEQGFVSGHVTKEEYENTSRAYQSRQDEMKSDDRDKAARHSIDTSTMRTMTCANLTLPTRDQSLYQRFRNRK